MIAYDRGRKVFKLKNQTMLSLVRGKPLKRMGVDIS